MNFQQLREKYKAPYNRELNEKKMQDPPPVLILQRTGVRDFPTGESVALYYNKQLKLTFSVPYNKNKKENNKIVNITAEEHSTENIIESKKVIRRLQSIVQNDSIGEVQFNNGASTKVSKTTAKYILDLHSKMTPDNQYKLSQMIAAAPENLNKVSEFAFKNLK